MIWTGKNFVEGIWGGVQRFLAKIVIMFCARKDKYSLMAKPG